MDESQPAGGDILVYAKVREPEAKLRLRQLLDDLPGERVNSTLYEVFAADWDEGLWEEEIERMRKLVDPETDTLSFGECLTANCFAPALPAGTPNQALYLSAMGLPVTLAPLPTYRCGG